MHEAQAHTGPTDVLPQASCGFYLVHHDAGFVLHMSASPEHLREMRQAVFKTVTGSGIGEEIADAAQLVARNSSATRCGSAAPGPRSSSRSSPKTIWCW
ncbi:hypothetical protein ACFWBS_38410 [Streptomyces mirabilis]|uniref:hypothetical protein n=1 Tax=Streptomyces mirabilis TaxID=68239 RepID=UPI00366257E3